MDSPLDSVDNIPYLSPDNIKPVERSKREGRRKFAKALKEQLEDEQEKRRKKRQKDEVVLTEDGSGETQEETPDGQADSEASEETQDASTESTDDADSEPVETRGRHIDVKA